MTLPSPKEALDSAIRRWILFSCGRRAAAFACLATLSVISAAALKLQFLPFWTAALLACGTTALLMIWLSAPQFMLLIERAAAEDRESWESRSSGIPPLDKLLKERRDEAAMMAESIVSLQEDLEGERARYKLLTDNLAAAVVIRDAQGKVTYCSPFTEVLTGYSTGEIYDSKDDFFHLITHEDDKDAYVRAMKIISAGEAFKFQHRFLHKTGIEMWAETRAVPVVDAVGDVSASLSITLDMTGALRYQRQVEEKNRDLQDFTYMVSHDLKAPIFTIKGMAAVMEEDGKGKLPSEVLEPLRHIGMATSRLEQLVASVLQYSRISSQELKFEAVDLRAVLEDIKNDFAAQIRESGAELNLSGEMPVVAGERVRIYQIFSNLVGNSLKYRRKDAPPRIEIRSEAPPHSRVAKLTVADNGEGIPADKLENIFRPFHRLHGSEIEGSGIGLACVKKILEKLGGSIMVKSVPGQGSEFSISLRKAAQN